MALMIHFFVGIKTPGELILEYHSEFGVFYNLVFPFFHSSSTFAAVAMRDDDNFLILTTLWMVFKGVDSPSCRLFIWWKMCEHYKTCKETIYIIIGTTFKRNLKLPDKGEKHRVRSLKVATKTEKRKNFYLIYSRLRQSAKRRNGTEHNVRVWRALEWFENFVLIRT